MKKFLIVVILCFLSVSNYGQEKLLNEITSFKIKNSGTFMDKNNDVDGYYFYYEVDKLKKGKREYAINMLDNNLNEIATKSYIGNKGDILIESKFNNQSLMLTMINLGKRHYKLVTFNKNGEQGEDIIIPLSRMNTLFLESMYKSNKDFVKPLFPVDNKGFIFNHMTYKNRAIASKLKYFPTDGGKSWVYEQVLEKKKPSVIKVLEANEKYVVLLEGITSMGKKRNGKDATSIENIIVLDVNTGESLFKKKYDKNDFRSVSNAFLTADKNLVLLGEYFNKSDELFKNKSLGLFAQVLDIKGTVVSDKKISWELEINKALGTENIKEGEYIFFHDIIRTQKGTYYAMAEKFHKTLNSRGKVENSITVTDAVVFAFDDAFNLEEVEVFKKEKSVLVPISALTEVTSPSELLETPQLYARLVKAFGGFDYEFTQIDKDRDRFYATYINYDTSKKEDKKIVLKTIIYNEDKLSEDEITLTESKGDDVSYRILPGKLGYIMLLEYNKEKKALNMRLERLNIE
ncbi:DUF6770 family protein [Pontimicrobium sp. MEBiC01747]